MTSPQLFWASLLLGLITFWPVSLVAAIGTAAGLVLAVIRHQRVLTARAWPLLTLLIFPFVPAALAAGFPERGDNALALEVLWPIVLTHAAAALVLWRTLRPLHWVLLVAACWSLWWTLSAAFIAAMAISGTWL